MAPGGVTRAILLAIVLLYGAMLGFDALASRGGEPGPRVDLLAPSFATLRAFGVLAPLDVFECGKVWLLVTPIFLHLGLVHLFFNAWSLRTLGPLAEEAFGARAFVALWVATGVVGNVVSAFAGTGGAGASGSVFGVMGAILVYARRRRGSIGPTLVYRWLLQWLLYAALVSLFVPRVNHYAHAAGFVAGAGLGLLADRVAAPRAWSVAGRVALAVVAIAFAATAIEAPRVGRRGALVAFVETAESGRRAAAAVVSAGGADPDARVALREAIARLERPSGAGAEVEGFRLRFLAALRGIDDAPGADEAASRLLPQFRETRDEFAAWIDAHACAYGVPRSTAD